MKLSRLLATSALGTVLFAAPAALADDAPFSFTGSVAFTTDYVFRGFTQTDSKPAVQAALTLNTPSGFFLSAWGSNVDFADGGDASAEIDYTIGFTNSVDALTYSIVGIIYSYPGGDLPGRNQPGYEYFEAGLTASYALDMFTPSVGVYYSPDFFLETGDAWYLTGGLKMVPAEGIAVYGNIGLQTIEKSVDDIYDWNLGITGSFYGIDLDLKYTDTDVKGSKFADERVVFTVTKVF
jgi:uncharacterized protein (TIGR02001 family)